MGRRSTLRASDHDRERIADRLRKAAAEGRLFAEELEQRIEATFRARTYGELDALVADLPDDEVVATGSRQIARAPRPLAVLAVALVVAGVMALVALVITGTVLAGGAWILFGAWFFGCRSARHRAHYTQHSQGHWQQVGPADRQAWL
jgi:hypothetical protein